jgi:hypothetical protein
MPLPAIAYSPVTSKRQSERKVRQSREPDWVDVDSRREPDDEEESCSSSMPGT